MKRFSTFSQVIWAGLLFFIAGAAAQEAAHYADGKFTYPNVWPSTFQIGQAMNITWETDFERSNLWLIQNGDWAHSVGIVCK